MNYRVLAIGKPKLQYAAAGVEEYAKRLKRYANVGIEFAKQHDTSKASGCYRIALDERGKAMNTDDLVARLNALELRGEIKSVAFLIGGADGHDDALRESCDEVWSLSALTLQHELALVVLLEQLYRAFTIKRGEPYHRP